LESNDMSTTPATILARLVRRFGLLVAVTALGAAAGGTYGAVKTPVYQAQAYVVLTAEPGEPFAAVNFAQAYGRIATDGPVAEAAATALGSRDGLSAVTATTSPDAPVIEITATGADATRTAAVANAVATALADYATARKAQTRVSASVLAPAATPTAPSSPKPPLELAVGAAAGLLLGGLAALAGVGRARRGSATVTATVEVDTGQDVVTIAPARPGTVWAAASVATTLLPPPEPAGPPPNALGWNAAPPEPADPPPNVLSWNADPAGPPPSAFGWNALPAQAADAPPYEPGRDAVAPPPPAGPPKITGRAVVIRRESL
jgi:uncharacterized protein involved in exopolysaccharide biosynthesis